MAPDELLALIRIIGPDEIVWLLRRRLLLTPSRGKLS